MPEMDVMIRDGMGKIYDYYWKLVCKVINDAVFLQRMQLVRRTKPTLTEAEDYNSSYMKELPAQLSCNEPKRNGALLGSNNSMSKVLKLVFTGNSSHAKVRYLGVEIMI